VLEFEQRAARRRWPLEDLRTLLSLAQVKEQLLERSSAESLLEQEVTRIEGSPPIAELPVGALSGCPKHRFG
jgi:hypothetical protein